RDAREHRGVVVAAERARSERRGRGEREEVGLDRPAGNLTAASIQHVNATVRGAEDDLLRSVAVDVVEERRRIARDSDRDREARKERCIVMERDRAARLPGVAEAVDDGQAE